jgi:methylated-DNA-[protein]-cysteine S-methyltransferase
MNALTTSPDDRSFIDHLQHSFDTPGTEAMEQLCAQLVARAANDELLDLAYRTIDSPLGPLLTVATPEGLVRIAFEREGHDDVLSDLADLAARLSPRILRSERSLEPATRQIGEYFEGRRRQFDLPVDLSLAHGFRRDVLDHLRAIPYGTTWSYRAVAQAAGNPGAVRAVGSACANNPVPVVVPCHRVVRSDGTIGGYRGGPEAKRVLLGLEAA